MSLLDQFMGALRLARCGVLDCLAPGDNPDRFLVALAALSLLAETPEEQLLLRVTADQTGTLREIKRSGGALWRAYQLKESLRAVFAGDLDTPTTNILLDRWCSKAQRSRIPEFIKAARTIQKHRDGIAAAIERGLSNGRHEGLNNKIRFIIRRAYGFHSAQAALATIMLTCGPVNL